MKNKISHFFHSIELSAWLTFTGIVLLFSGAVVITLVAPSFVEQTWIEPTSPYQVQMYEIADPHFYISSSGTRGNDLQFVYHLKNDFSLHSFKETESIKILADKGLEKYVTRKDDPILKLTSRLLLLRKGDKVSEHAQAGFEIFELYDPQKTEVFALAPTDGILQDWVDENFEIVEKEYKASYHQGPGVIYVNNPMEFRFRSYSSGMHNYWQYDPNGKSIDNLQELTSEPLAFRSRKELIEAGEHIYAIEGCWYCHTDQTRTLIQDLVLNGSDSYPAPPSSPNEYIYQRITFPGTKRNGPDLSRVGIKRPSRDWHKAHFWSPTTQNRGSIMPSYRHFFDFDPRGTSRYTSGVPNYQFEAIFQYLMTKGTRITPPTQAWWVGKDPIQTKEIIEGIKTLP
ncbi:Uncharacterized protein PHSC3_000832 [Chlamydiales bacterium STE3]|nr:Uncharacterized protein PHSC3_000832 [Chlamydiales bacterium STE3]